MSLQGLIGQVMSLGRYAPEQRGGNIWMRCPFHKGGKERTASFIVNTNPHGRHPPGSAHCFGCGYTAKNWSTLAQALKLKDYEDWDEGYLSLTTLATTELEEGFEDFADDEGYVDPVPVTERWRGIGPKMLGAVKAEYRYFKPYRSLAVYLPVFVHGRKLGAIYAEIVKTRKNSYLETPGAWKKNAWYPFDYTASVLEKTERRFVVLVEGPRDALRFCQCGIPALAMLGASGWSDRKGDLLDALPLDLVYTAFDGDEAGDMASDVVKEKCPLPTKKLRLLKGEDPGNMTPDRVAALKSFLKVE